MMTADEAREAILLAILDCELEDARGETFDPIRETKPAKGWQPTCLRH